MWKCNLFSNNWITIHVQNMPLILTEYVYVHSEVEGSFIIQMNEKTRRLKGYLYTRSYSIKLDALRLVIKIHSDPVLEKKLKSLNAKW